MNWETDLSSPLSFTVSWHEGAGQRIPKLQMGTETRAKAAEAQSVMRNTWGRTSVCVAGEVILAHAFGP